MAADLVFLDTNGWLALLNASDALHLRADSLWREFTSDRHFEQAGFRCLLPTTANQ